MSWTAPPREIVDYDAIRDRVNISDVLVKYTSVPVTGSGRYRIPCPLHNGDSNNFSVDEENGLFYCYVCHAGGDVIKLVAAFEQCKNGQAAESLAREFSIDNKLDPFTKTIRRTARHMQAWKENHTAPSVEDGLPETVELYAYRSFTKQAIDYFGLQLIPGRGWGEGIFIPIRTNEGKVVGYTVRHWDDFLQEYQEKHNVKLPKYLNTDGLRKRGLVFGLFENQDDIQTRGFAYLVEGQFDCVNMWMNGFRNTVSLMGSNMSQQQAMMLMKYTSKLILVLDGDDAGRAGAVQIKERFGSAFNIQIVQLPEGQDPSSVDLEGIL